MQLHPAELHHLACAARQMGFAEIARRFAVAIPTVSQTVSRLAGYSPAEPATVARFVGDLDAFARGSLATIAEPPERTT